MLSLPRLYAILDVDVATTAGWAPADLAHAYFDGGARWLQIRAKHLGSGAFLDLSERVRDLAATAGATVVINDRVDVAHIAGIPAVHVGQDDLPVAAARALLGPSALIGFSTHTRTQIAEAVRMSIDYLAVGPIFGTATKDTGYSSVGIDLIRLASDEAEASSHRSLPIVAIGGITLDRARAAIDAGASSVAVISDLLTGGDPQARVRAFVERLA